jgi:uncharacterized protein YbjT (DUF2867 family)
VLPASIEGLRGVQVRVVITGASGMIGQGVLRECLLDPDVTDVLTLGRTPTGQTHAKLREVVHGDFLDYAAVEDRLTGYDACLFCLGVSSVGMNEADYQRITYEYTLAAARTLLRLNPDLTFVYVSGQGTDSTASGRTMWARVKGRTENDLLALTDRAYMFRPGYIQPMHGIQSRTRAYRIMYRVVVPLFPVLRRLFPSSVTTTETLGRAMINVVRHGAPTHVLHSRDINAVGAAT